MVVVSIKLPAVHTVNQGPGGVRALHPTLQHLQNIEGSGLSTPLSSTYRTWRGPGSPPHSPTPTENGEVRALHLILSNTYRTWRGQGSPPHSPTPTEHGGVRALHPTLQHLQNMELHLILSNTYRTWRGQGFPPYTLQHQQNMERSGFSTLYTPAGLSTPLSNNYRTWRGQGSPPFTLQHPQNREGSGLSTRVGKFFRI